MEGVAREGNTGCDIKMEKGKIGRKALMGREEGGQYERKEGAGTNNTTDV